MTKTHDDKRTETHACDLISRQAALDALADYIHNVDRVYSTGKLTHEDCMDAAHSILDELPSAQPGIIACGDCKHWICHDRRCGYWNHGVNPLDWCCHAERGSNG